MNSVKVSPGAQELSPGTLFKGMERQRRNVSSPGMEKERFMPGESDMVSPSAAQMKAAQGISLDRAADMVTSHVSSAAMVWEFETGNWVTSSPCLGPDGTVYVGSEDRKVYALKDGKKLWDYETGNLVTSSPCLGPDGTVYVGSRDYKVYALRSSLSDCADSINKEKSDPVPGADASGLSVEEGWIIAGDVRLKLNDNGS